MMISVFQIRRTPLCGPQPAPPATTALLQPHGLATRTQQPGQCELLAQTRPLLLSLHRHSRTHGWLKAGQAEQMQIVTFLGFAHLLWRGRGCFAPVADGDKAYVVTKFYFIVLTLP